VAGEPVQSVCSYNYRAVGEDSQVSVTMDLYQQVTPTMQQKAADAFDDLLSAPVAVNLADTGAVAEVKQQVSPRMSEDRASVS
jgi:hypothetical protein